MTELSIIIVNFNTAGLIEKCIASIFQSKVDFDFEVIIFDNASTDISRDTLSKIRNKKVKVILNNENIGFSRANNLTTRLAKGNYLFFLNPDCEVKRDSIFKLYRFAKGKADAGVVGPKLLNPDGSIQASCFRLPTLKRTVSQYWFGKVELLDKYAPVSYEPIEVESLVGAAFLVTPTARKKVGLWDEKYFMYFEDLDYCRRAKKAGLKIYYTSYAEVFHHHGISGSGLADNDNQWRRLIPSSKIYHGIFQHYLITFIIWSGQKWRRLFKRTE